jgi:hypothetical protein
VLRPTLWNTALDFFLNSQHPHGVELIAYADDIVAIIQDDCRAHWKARAQSFVDGLSGWARHNKLTISAQKRKIMVLKSPNRTHNRDIRLRVQGTVLGVVNSIRYLGIQVDSKLTYSAYINQMCEKTRRTMAALRSKVRNTWHIPVSESVYTIYKNGIIPILSYGSEVWAHRIHTERNKRKINSLTGSLVGLSREVTHRYQLTRLVCWWAYLPST